MPDFRYVVADVFTDRALEGNQLAVFTDARAIDEQTMQALALEIGFSETTFVLPPEQGGTVRIRIFTPRSELPFAGHPCLGTAWVLASSLQRGVIELETQSGIVPVELEREGSGKIVFGRMSQPLPSVEPYPDPDALLRALGVGGSELPVERYDNGVRHTFVTLGSFDEVAALRPDFSALTRARGHGELLRGLRRRLEDARVRSFGRGARGSGDGLGGRSARRPPLPSRSVEWGEWIEIAQGAEIGRPSTLFARADARDGKLEHVSVGGHAVVVARGEFRL